MVFRRGGATRDRHEARYPIRNRPGLLAIDQVAGAAKLARQAVANAGIACRLGLGHSRMARQDGKHADQNEGSPFPSTHVHGSPHALGQLMALLDLVRDPAGCAEGQITDRDDADHLAGLDHR